MGKSPRLAALVTLTPAGSRLVDVGTDHAYYPIALVESGKINAAIAVDLRQGPLDSARAHIAESGLSKKIQTRLSNGLQNVSSKDGNTLSLCGMGGKLICEILSFDREKSAAFPVWILQPQKDAAAVRRFVYEAGYHIEKEDFVREGTQYYPMLLAKKGAAAMPSEAELVFGPVLLREQHPVVKGYLVKRIEGRAQLAEKLKEQKTDTAAKRAKELEAECALMQKALAYF